MSKLVSVSQLKAGDKFAFLNSPSSGAPSPLNEESKTVYVVTRQPAVNLAANTCYFRYQPAGMSEADVAHGGASRSFNGSPDLKVSIPGAESDEPPSAVMKSSVKLAGQTELAPPANHETKAAARSAPAKPEAPSATATKSYALPKFSKRVVDFSSAERAEPRQEGAILPALSKASSAEPAETEPAETMPDETIANGEPTNRKQAAPKKPARKEAANKEIAKKEAAKPAKKAAAKKPLKKAAAAKSAEKGPAKKSAPKTKAAAKPTKKK